jgi:hypothetical protein
VTLNDGVSLYGGYDAASGGSEAGANHHPPESDANRHPCAEPAATDEVKGFQIVSADATGTALDGDGEGETSVGILVSNATQLTIRGCNIIAGNGSPCSV